MKFKLKDYWYGLDYLYDQHVPIKFINSLHYKSGNNLNKKLFINLFKLLKKDLKKDNLELLLLAACNGSNELILTEIEIAGKTHRIAVPVGLTKQLSRFFKNIIFFGKKNTEKKFLDYMSKEIKLLINNKRGAIEMQQDKLYEEAIEELPFTHFRWR
jgi:ribosomal protein S7